MKTALYKINLPLRNIVRLSDYFLINREVGILKIENMNHIGFGEASPLPHFNLETIEEVQKSFANQNSELPSLNWAYYNAQKDWNTKVTRTLTLSGLILETEKSYLYKAVEFEKLCYKVVKLKVGGDLKADREKILHICKATEELKLRLDFNSRGNLESLELFLGELPADRIEYIEDPLASDNFEQLEHLYTQTKMPYAIDYTDQKVPAGLKGLKAIIVKPMRVHVSKIKELQKNNPNSQIILSSSFESNLGLFLIAKLAFELGIESLSHGLDTFDYFNENVFPIHKKLNQLILPSDEEVKKALIQLTGKLKPIA